MIIKFCSFAKDFYLRNEELLRDIILNSSQECLLYRKLQIQKSFSDPWLIIDKNHQFTSISKNIVFRLRDPLVISETCSSISSIYIEV